MRDVELLVFEGYHDLAERLLPGADDGMPRGRVAVHEAVDGAGTAAILVESIGAPIGAPSGVSRISARMDPARKRVVARPESRAVREDLYEIRRSEECGDLIKAIRPVKITDASAPDASDHVIVWCGEGRELARITRECLSLGCDRIRWSSVESEDQNATVLRIGQPPWFLLERWSRDDSTALFVPAAERFYVPWGHAHPLSGRLRPAGGELILAELDGTVRRIPDGEWRDLYEAVSVDVEQVHSRQWSPADPPPRFTVRLQLVEIPNPSEPELWLLTREDLPAVERLLSLLPDAELNHLAIAFFAAPEDFTVAGSTSLPVAALREVITGRGRSRVDFTTAGFRAASGLSNLFLPVTRALDPPIRRDRIAEAFGLTPGEITVVPGDGKPAVRIPENGFKPLESYIDYVVTGDAVRLRSLVAATVFDPGPLAELSPAPPDEPKSPRPPEIGSVRPPNRSAADGGESTAAATPAAAPEAVEAPGLEHAPEAGSVPEPPLRHRIEARIAREPPGASADWLSLGEFRAESGEWEDALEAFENARWLDPSVDVDARERSTRVLERRLGTPGPLFPAAGASGGVGAGQIGLASLRLRSLYLEAGRAADALLGIDDFRPLYRAAREAGPLLRKKSRWLVWRALLSRTGDEIELERQREAILAELNQEGLRPLDRADFVRARIAEEEPGGNESDLRRLLEGLTARVAGMKDARLRGIGTALLARQWAEIDDVGHARRLAFDAAGSTAGTSSAAAARIGSDAAAALLRLGDAEGSARFEEALNMSAAIPNDHDRMRTLQALLGSLASVGDPKRTSALAGAALSMLDGEDPRLAARTLAPLVPALQRLELRTRASQLALRLALHPAIKQDAHYLSFALDALAASSGGSVPAESLATILDAVREHQADLQDVNAGLFESAVKLGGEEFARELSDQIRGTPPTGIRFAHISSWAFAIQGLAAAGTADAGMSDLDRALGLAWSLSNDDERRRSVRRLTGVIPAFGRVSAGLEMIHEVVRRSEEPDVGPYFRSEVLSACVAATAKLGGRSGSFEVMDRVIRLVEETAAASTADVTFLFDVLGHCVDHAVALGAAELSTGTIERVERAVEAPMKVTSGRYWTPFYRYRVLARCGRGLARLGQESRGLQRLDRVLHQLEKSDPITGLDRIDLLRELVSSLPEFGGQDRLGLVGRILDALLTARNPEMGNSAADLLSLLLGEVVSPASRVRAEYARYLGADERAIRQRVANERIVST